MKICSHILLWIVVGLLFANGEVFASVKPLKSSHIRDGLPFFFQKIEKKQPVTIVWFGGSITHAPGYREYTTQWMKDNFKGVAIESVNAAIPGTGSDLGVFRLKDDALKYNPDLVFVEFAVNDRKTDSLTILNSMEGIVRQIKTHNPEADICFVYTISEDVMLGPLVENKLPHSVSVMEQVADHYGIPTINFGVDVAGRWKKGILQFTGKEGEDTGGKILFTTDGVHPTIEEGHRIFAGTFEKAFPAFKTKVKRNSAVLNEPLSAGNYQHVHAYSPLLAQRNGWRSASYKKDAARYMEAFPDMIYTYKKEDSLVFRFKGTKAGIYDLIGPFGTNISVSIDGGEAVEYARFDDFCTYVRQGFCLFNDLPDGIHTVTIKLGDTESMDKLKILQKRKPELDHFEALEENTLYIGKILIVGEWVE